MKTIPDFTDYAITKEGKVWSKRYYRWIKPVRVGIRNCYYYAVKLNGRKRRYIHRLVLETYIGKCPKNMECRHLNGDHMDNRLENLCWGTRKENTRDAIKQGKHMSVKNRKSKIKSDMPIIKIGDLFKIKDCYFEITEVNKEGLVAKSLSI